MIRSFRSEKAKWLAGELVCDKSILSGEAYAAGGFALSLYKALRLYDSDEKWSLLERASEYCKKTNDSSTLRKMIPEFGDIDIWHKKESRFFQDASLSWVLDKGGDSLFEKFCEKPFEKEHSLIKTSDWANSFKASNGWSDFNFPIQFIKKPIVSVEHLFSDFDFKNCCVAYNDGNIYYIDELDDCFKNFKLELNNASNYTGEPIAQRVYAALRAFKYSKRFMLDFSEDLSELVFKLYLDIYDLRPSGESFMLDNNVYGEIIISSGDLRDMIASFESNFKYFSSMQTFRKEYAIYLLDRGSPYNVMEILDKEYNKEVGSLKIGCNIPF